MGSDWVSLTRTMNLGHPGPGLRYLRALPFLHMYFSLAKLMVSWFSDLLQGKLGNAILLCR
jgi:hypothetical protein